MMVHHLKMVFTEQMFPTVLVNIVTRSQLRPGTRMGDEAFLPHTYQSRMRQQVPMTSDAYSALANDKMIGSAAEFEKKTNMVADTRTATSSPPDQQGPLPMGAEEMVCHLANTVDHLTEQLQTIHEHLDRQSQRLSRFAQLTHRLQLKRGNRVLAGCPLLQPLFNGRNNENHLHHQTCLHHGGVSSTLALLAKKERPS